MLSRHVLRRLPLPAHSQQLLRAGAPHIRRSLATAVSPSPNDPFANGTNAYYVEEMYRHWRQDPKSVHVSWDAYFSGMDKGLPSQKAFQPPPNLVPAPADGAPALHAGGGAELDDHLKVGSHPILFCYSFLTCSLSDPTARSCVPGSRSPYRRPRPPRHPGCGSQRHSSSRTRVEQVWLHGT